MTELDSSRAYVMHLCVEHRRLHETVRSVLAILDERKTRADCAPALLEELALLRNRLTSHFATEEQGGCLEEAVCRCPQLSAAVTELEREHPVLLRDLETLIDRTAKLPNSDYMQGIASDFSDFADRLRAHEAGENRILRRAFGAAFDFDDENTV